MGRIAFLLMLSSLAYSAQLHFDQIAHWMHCRDYLLLSYRHTFATYSQRHYAHLQCASLISHLSQQQS